ncbi:MAG: ribonuclease P protein component [Proteobacteria bacterium]|nr:ribonuclease P protein component [Pseudomonadota bacterium]
MPRFRKSSRMLAPEDFAAVKKRGRAARSGPMAVAFLSGGAVRLGIAVSAAVGNAVERNRIKRVVREFFRLNRAMFPDGDCVVIPGRGVAQMKNEEIRQRLARALLMLSK